MIMSACSYQEHEPYDVLPNSIRAGGTTINYDSQSSLTNISEITSELGEKDGAIFNESLSWYGTESDFGFDRIHSKTARQLVNIVNCLKVTDKENKPLCFQ
jgi:hypothetical protein